MEKALLDSEFVQWLISALSMTPEGNVVVDGRVTYWKSTFDTTITLEVYSLSEEMSSWWAWELDGDVMSATWVGTGRRGRDAGIVSIYQMLYARKGRQFKRLSMDCLRGVPIGEALSFLPGEKAESDASE
jgi:hypothetical protein